MPGQTITVPLVTEASTASWIVPWTAPFLHWAAGVLSTISVAADAADAPAVPARVAATAIAGAAQADKLDDIIASGTLRCAVVLDFPPMGMRDEQNNPIGFDVDYCNDLAKALGVTAEIVETPFPERIPALMAGRVDVGVASTSDTLERAKTVGMSIPYYAFENAVVAREGSAADAGEDAGPLPVRPQIQEAGSAHRADQHEVGATVASEQVQDGAGAAHAGELVRVRCENSGFGKALQSDDEHLATGREGSVSDLTRQWSAAGENTQATLIGGMQLQIAGFVGFIPP